MEKRVFAIAAHPDDIEFMMAGTMMLLKERSYELHYMTVANGSCGTAEHDRETIIQIRRQESINAAEFIGAVYHESLCDDIEIFYEKKLLTRLGSVIREVAPEILLVPSPVDYMEDHVNTSRLAVTAAFCRGMINFPVSPPRETVDHDVTIYHALPYGLRDQLRRAIRAEIYVDITEEMKNKEQMLVMHKSQKEWLDKSQGINSYILAMTGLAKQAGKLSGRYEYAEGWQRHFHPGLCSENADPLSDVLKGKCFVDCS